MEASGLISLRFNILLILLWFYSQFENDQQFIFIKILLYNNNFQFSIAVTTAKHKKKIARGVKTLYKVKSFGDQNDIASEMA